LNSVAASSASRLAIAAHQVRRERVPEFIIAGEYFAGTRKPGVNPAYVLVAASASTAEGYWAFAIIDLSA
jgi:hypothetical protein